MFVKHSSSLSVTGFFEIASWELLSPKFSSLLFSKKSSLAFQASALLYYIVSWNVDFLTKGLKCLQIDLTISPSDAKCSAQCQTCLRKCLKCSPTCLICSPTCLICSHLFLKCSHLFQTLIGTFQKKTRHYFGNVLLISALFQNHQIQSPEMAFKKKFFKKYINQII